MTVQLLVCTVTSPLWLLASCTMQMPHTMTCQVTGWFDYLPRFRDIIKLNKTDMKANFKKVLIGFNTIQWQGGFSITEGQWESFLWPHSVEVMAWSPDFNPTVFNLMKFGLKAYKGLEYKYVTMLTFIFVYVPLKLGRPLAPTIDGCTLELEQLMD